MFIILLRLRMILFVMLFRLRVVMIRLVAFCARFGRFACRVVMSLSMCMLVLRRVSRDVDLLSVMVLLFRLILLVGVRMLLWLGFGLLLFLGRLSLVSWLWCLIRRVVLIWMLR